MKKGSLRTSRKKSGNKKAKQSPAPSLRRKKNPPRSIPNPKTTVPAAQRREFQTTPIVGQDLPFSYGETKLVLLVRDPFWAYSYWDFSSETWDWIVAFRRRDAGVRAKLRIRNLDLGEERELDVQIEAKNWYLQLGQPNTSFEAELGLVDSAGCFHLIARSNRIRTPRNAPSDVIDPNWNPDDFDLIYQLSGGGKLGKSSDMFSRIRPPGF